MPIYTCAELEGRIKVGHKVKYAEGELGLCSHLEDGKTGAITKVNEAGFWINDCFHTYSELFSVEILDEGKTLDTVDVGDAVFNSIGRAYVILDTSKNGTILFLSNNESGLYDFSATRAYLKKACFTVKQPSPEPEITEMTVEEAEAKLSTEGKKVKIIQE